MLGSNSRESEFDYKRKRYRVSRLAKANERQCDTDFYKSSQSYCPCQKSTPIYWFYNRLVFFYYVVFILWYIMVVQYMTNITSLHLRKNTYYIRISVPNSIKDLVKKNEIKYSLKANNYFYALSKLRIKTCLHCSLYP